MNNKYSTQEDINDKEQIFTISNNVFRIKKTKSQGANRRNFSVQKGKLVKNNDFSFKNFNLTENFKKPELVGEVFLRMNKTINLLRIYSHNILKKYFVRWSEPIIMKHLNDDKKRNDINYKTIELLSNWYNPHGKRYNKGNMREEISITNSKLDGKYSGNGIRTKSEANSINNNQKKNINVYNSQNYNSQNKISNGEYSNSKYNIKDAKKQEIETNNERQKFPALEKRQSITFIKLSVKMEEDIGNESKKDQIEKEVIKQDEKKIEKDKTDDKKYEIENEIKQENKLENKQDMKQEIKPRENQDIKYNKKNEIIEEVTLVDKQEIKREVKTEIKQDIKEEKERDNKNDLKPEIKQEVQTDIKKGVKLEEKQEIKYVDNNNTVKRRLEDNKQETLNQNPGLIIQNNPQQEEKEDSFVIVEKEDIATGAKYLKNIIVEKKPEIKVEHIRDPSREKLIRKITQIKASLEGNPITEKELMNSKEYEFINYGNDDDSSKREFDESIHLVEEEIENKRVATEPIVVEKKIDEKVENANDKEDLVRRSFDKKMSSKTEVMISILENYKDIAKDLEQDDLANISNNLQRAKTLGLMTNNDENINENEIVEIENLQKTRTVENIIYINNNVNINNIEKKNEIENKNNNLNEAKTLGIINYNNDNIIYNNSEKTENNNETISITNDENMNVNNDSKVISQVKIVFNQKNIGLNIKDVIPTETNQNTLFSDSFVNSDDLINKNININYKESCLDNKDVNDGYNGLILVSDANAHNNKKVFADIIKPPNNKESDLKIIAPKYQEEDSILTKLTDKELNRILIENETNKKNNSDVNVNKMSNNINHINNSINNNTLANAKNVTSDIDIKIKTFMTDFSSQVDKIGEKMNKFNNIKEELMNVKFLNESYNNINNSTNNSRTNIINDYKSEGKNKNTDFKIIDSNNANKGVVYNTSQVEDNTHPEVTKIINNYNNANEIVNNYNNSNKFVDKQMKSQDFKIIYNNSNTNSKTNLSFSENSNIVNNKINYADTTEMKNMILDIHSNNDKIMNKYIDDDKSIYNRNGDITKIYNKLNIVNYYSNTDSNKIINDATKIDNKNKIVNYYSNTDNNKNIIDDKNITSNNTNNKYNTYIDNKYANNVYTEINKYNNNYVLSDTENKIIIKGDNDKKIIYNQPQEIDKKYIVNDQIKTNDIKYDYSFYSNTDKIDYTKNSNNTTVFEKNNNISSLESNLNEIDNIFDKYLPSNKKSEEYTTYKSSKEYVNSNVIKNEINKTHISIDTKPDNKIGVYQTNYYTCENPIKYNDKISKYENKNYNYNTEQPHTLSNKNDILSYYSTGNSAAYKDAKVVVQTPQKDTKYDFTENNYPLIYTPKNTNISSNAIDLIKYYSSGVKDTDSLSSPYNGTKYVSREYYESSKYHKKERPLNPINPFSNVFPYNLSNNVISYNSSYNAIPDNSSSNLIAYNSSNNLIANNDIKKEINSNFKNNKNGCYTENIYLNKNNDLITYSSGTISKPNNENIVSGKDTIINTNYYSNNDPKKINDLVYLNDKINNSSEKFKYEDKLNETFEAIKYKKPTPNPNIEQLLSNAKLTYSHFATSDGESIGFGNTKKVTAEAAKLPDYENQIQYANIITTNVNTNTDTNANGNHIKSNYNDYITNLYKNDFK